MLQAQPDPGMPGNTPRNRASAGLPCPGRRLPGTECSEGCHPGLELKIKLKPRQGQLIKAD